MTSSVAAVARRRTPAIVGGLLAAVAIGLALPALASAAGEKLYWGDGAGLQAGEPGGTPSSLFSATTYVTGLALVPASNTIYASSPGTEEIFAGDLEGTGPESTLIAGQTAEGIALDPAEERIFWVDESTGEVKSANLRDEDVETLYTEAGASPVGIAVDAETGKVFWGDWVTGKVMVGDVGGEAEGAAKALYEGEDGPEDVALDLASGKIYWTDARDGEIRVGDIDGSGAAQTLYTEAEGGKAYPWGVALDVSAGKIYWADADGDRLMAGALGGEAAAPAEAVFAGQDDPRFVALLHAPIFTSGAATVSGGKAGEVLDCSVTFAPDEPQANFYDEGSIVYRWMRDGVTAAETGRSEYTPSQAGSYACEAVATNAAGSSATGSANSVSVSLPSIPSRPSIYWGDFGGALETATSSGVLSTLFQGGEEDNGVALDPAAGEVFWADEATGEILAGGIDGEPGSQRTLFKGQNDPYGLTVDTATGELYWADYGKGEAGVGEVMAGSIEGEAAGKATMLFGGLDAPEDVAVDPADGRIFWTEADTARIVSGSLEGEAHGGAPALEFQLKAGSYPVGIALDAATGELYWSLSNAGEIMVGPIGGEAKGAAKALYSGVPGPTGIALDAAAQELYFVVGDDVLAAPLAGEAQGAPTSLLGDEAGPDFVALLGAPQPTSAPAVGGTAAIGSALTCSGGSWAGGEPGAQFAQAPRSTGYQWLHEGAPIAGATGPSYTPTSAGSYACEAVATNAAGTTSEQSGTVNVVAPPSTPLPAKPPATSHAKPKLSIGAVGKVARDRRLAISLSCSGAGKCKGKLTLVATVKLRAKGKMRRKRLVLASKSYSFAAGKHEKLTLKLSGKAIKLIRAAKHHALAAKAKATVSGGATVTQSVKLRLMHR